MKQKVHVIAITITAITMMVIVFVFAINYKNKAFNYFEKDGYIISNFSKEGANNVNKLYFNANEVYTNTKNDSYTFKDSDGQKVTVDEESFVHYSNGSIMSLKKGVAIDLNSVDSKIINYYNIFEGSVLRKKNDMYEIDNLNDSLNFSKLMFKISNDKYLIAYPKIVISFSDDQIVEMEDYVELEYVSKNVIRVYNDKQNYQTIASNLYLIVDNIKIDLEYKTIQKNNVEYLTMADMVINADDNIEVLPLPEKVEIPEDDLNNSGNVNNSGGNGSGENGSGGVQIEPGLQEGLDNIIGTLPEPGEQEEEKVVVQPKFKVESLDVTTLGFENLRMTLEDESMVLFGNRTVEILENSTGKVVQSFQEWNEGDTEYSINSYFSLKSNTAYTLNVTGQYKIDETVYDRTFISKMFRTLDVGLEIVEDYITSDSLSFAVYKNSYSEVNGFKYSILDQDGNVVVEDTKATFGDSNSVIITEEQKFRPNSKYVLNLKEIQYGNDVFSTVSYEQLKLTYDTKTLKLNPFKKVVDANGNEVSNVALKANVDNRNNTINFAINGINDINGGIKEYTYNIYNSAGELKQSIVKDNSDPLTLNASEFADEDVIYFNVVVNFDDNEKSIMYVSNNSEPISISGITYPKIVDFVHSEDNEDCESLYGGIVIDDSTNFIEMNSVSEYKLDIKENANSSLGGFQQYVGTINVEHSKQNNQFVLPVVFGGLKPNTEYVIYVYIKYEDKYIYLGYDIATTIGPEEIYLNFDYPSNLTTSENIMFNFEVSKNSIVTSDALKYLESLKLDMYACMNDSSKCEKLNFSSTIPKYQDDTSLKRLIDGEVINVSSLDFNFDINDYENLYNYKVVVQGYAKNYEIPVIINNTESNEFNIVFNNIAPGIFAHPIEILNEDCKGNVCIKDNSLEDDTVVGFDFEITTRQNPMGNYIEKMYYKIYEANADGVCTSSESASVLIQKEISLDKSKFNEVILLKDGLNRGTNYCMEYYGEYTGNDNNKLTTPKQYETFMGKKISAKITGHVDKYDGNLVVFDLNIVDPDKAVVQDSISLSDIKPTNVSEGKYTFTVPSSGNYSLKLKENLGDKEKEYKIYDAQLEELYEPNNIKMIVDTHQVGKITLKVPYYECAGCITNELTNVNRIAGISIKDSSNSKHYFNFKNNSQELYTEINISAIRENGYGKLTDNTLEFESGDINLIYDSGRKGNSNLVFIKSKTPSDVSLDYFNLSSKSFDAISSNSIFNADDNLDFMIVNTFDSKISGSKVGKSLALSDQPLQSVKFNALGESELVLYGIDNKEKLSFEVNQALTTSEINTVYTSTGANVSFNLLTETIKNGTKLRINLNNDSGLLEQVEVEASCNNDTCEWGSYSSASNDKKIRNLSVTNNEVVLKFDNISDGEYRYTVEYGKETESIYNYASTYNDGAGKLNESLPISSLKSLALINYASKLEKSYWNWTNASYEDLSFVKKIVTYFDVNTSKYELKTGEKIVYEILAESNGNYKKLIDITELNEKDETGVSKNTLEINLFETNFESGVYKILLKPMLEKNGEYIELESFVLESMIEIQNNEPIFSAKPNGNNLYINVEMNDESGLLTACPSDLLPKYNDDDIVAFATGADKIYYEKNLSKSKMVYFEFYYKSGDSLDYKGYSPVSFNNRTAQLHTVDYFNRKNLESGDYMIKVNYCLTNKEGIQTLEFDNLKIYNTKSLKLSLLPFSGFYMLMMSNPNETLKDQIKIIEYQYMTSGGYIMKKLDNTDDNLTNDFVYSAIQHADGTTSYMLPLYTDGSSITAIQNISVKFLDESGYVITQIDK